MIPVQLDGLQFVMASFNFFRRSVFGKATLPIKPGRYLLGSKLYFTNVLQNKMLKHLGFETQLMCETLITHDVF